ncbi:ABC transporter B family member 15 [Citrus sinensis]|nr:ABC transporter B family member 15 [Citrus sinensis]
MPQVHKIFTNLVVSVSLKMSREREGGRKNMFGSFRSIFMHADRVDMFLMVLGFIAAICDGLSTPLLTFVMCRLMNNVGNASSLPVDVFTHQLYNNAVMILYLVCIAWIAAFLEAYCWTRTGERQATRMRAVYLKAILRQDVGYFDLHVTSTAEIISSVSNDTLVIQDVLSEKLPNFLVNVAVFFGSYIVGFMILWQLVVVGFPFVVLLVVLGLIYGRILMAISSVRTVYAFVGEGKTLDEFSSALQGSVKLGLKQGLCKGFASGINAITYAIWSFLAYYGSRLVMYHGAKGGAVFAAGTTIVVGGQALGAGLSNLKYISEAASAGEHIRDVIKRVPDIDSENMEGEILEKFLGEVEFRNVVFAYPSRPETIIFKDFCLKVPAGNTVALVGGSGSGKSTVVSLLQRFYVAIDKLQLKWLRSQMGLVSQEPALFATSIKENILFGKEDASMEEIIEAAKASNAHNFICQLPQQYDTQVGERGVQMSGGQKQRIAIARAIIKSPRILLLDEATSALDSESERVVQEALENAAVGRTTIVIAHRLSTIRSADVIVVIQNGQVMETGSHDELIQDENGLYTALVHLHQTEKRNKNPGEGSIMDLNNKDLHSLSSLSNLTDVNSISSSRFSQVSRSSSDVSFSQSRASLEDGNLKQNNREEDNKKLTAPSFRRLLALNLREWKQASLGCLSAILFGAVQPVYAFAMGSMISVYFLKDHDEIKEKTRFYSLCFFGLSIFSLLTNILTFEVGWFDQDENSSGAICSRLAKDANVVRSLVGDRVALLVQTLSSITIAFTMSLIISWRLALVIIAVQPLVIVCFYGKEAQDESSKLAAEAVSNLRTITAFSSQERILKMLEKAQEAPRREGVRQSWIAGICLAFSRALVSCVVALAFWYGGRLVARGYINAKSLFEIFLVLVSTGKVIADAGTMTTDIAKGSNAVASVFAVLDRDTKINPEDPKGYRPEKITGHIELQYVHFAYPARPDVMIFKGFSINIVAEKSTALVGQSGSGKSTIIGLIERFYDPLKGAVKIDGEDIRSYHLRSLRRHVALVSQEPALFAGTVRENITYGASDKIDESEIIEAAKAANAHDFIAGLSEGYDTWCGDRGLQLSGGQKQRIAIARAILKNPAVLLLDEATSALDSQSEKLVQEALERLMVGRTSVVVAHRLSTIQNCDMIAVLEQGRVVEEGSHESLLAKGPAGAYYSLVSLQTAEQN